MRHRPLPAHLAVAVAAVTFGALGACDAEPASPAPAAAADLVVHEWSLVTSLQGADGEPVDGVGHAEEALPGFVHATAPDLAPFAVRQQLQTPVLYFHGVDAGVLDVALDLPDGAFAGWYPSGAVGARPAGGERATFRIELGAPDLALGLAPTDGSAVWDALRAVDASVVQVGAERERFVFYRGLARVPERVRVRHADDGRLAIENTGAEPVAAAFLVHVHAGGSALDELGPIAAGATVFASPAPKELDPDVFAADATRRVVPALEAAGLAPDEARAAVASWAANVFRTPGVRLVYVWPRAWVDALLPLALTPAPRELVRVHVGRVEVLTRWEEAELVEQIRQAQPTADTSLVATLGAFAEAKLRRARDLIADASLRAFADELVALAAAP